MMRLVTLAKIGFLTSLAAQILSMFGWNLESWILQRKNGRRASKSGYIMAVSTVSIDSNSVPDAEPIPNPDDKAPSQNQPRPANPIPTTETIIVESLESVSQQIDRLQNNIRNRLHSGPKFIIFEFKICFFSLQDNEHQRLLESLEIGPNSTTVTTVLEPEAQVQESNTISWNK